MHPHEARGVPPAARPWQFGCITPGCHAREDDHSRKGATARGTSSGTKSAPGRAERGGTRKMTFKRNLIIGGACVALLALVACEKNNKPEETQTTGATQGNNTAAANNATDKDKDKSQPNAATPDPNQSTIMRVTQARCQREMVCGKIGADKSKKWTDEQACRDDLG